MPAALLAAYAAMLPRLQAQESLRRIQEVSLGFGGSGKERDQAIRELERESGIKPKLMSPQEIAEAFGAAGVPVRQVVAHA